MCGLDLFILLIYICEKAKCASAVTTGWRIVEYEKCFIGDIVFDNAMVEDLTVYSNIEAWRGSWKKNHSFNIGFIECSCPKDATMVDLNMSTYRASLASLCATLNVDWPLLFLTELW